MAPAVILLSREVEVEEVEVEVEFFFFEKKVDAEKR